MTTESKELDNYKLTKSYFTGSQKTPLTNLTIGQYFDSIVDNHSQREAIVVSHQSIRLTYRQYLDKINQLAASYWQLAYNLEIELVFGLPITLNGAWYNLQQPKLVPLWFA